MGKRAKPLLALLMALTSIMFTGLGLIITSMVIGVNIINTTPFYYISYGILGFGTLLILIGLFGIMGIVKQIRTLADEGGYSIEESPTYASSKTTKVIRQQMPKPIADDQIPKPKANPKQISSGTSQLKSPTPPTKPKDTESSWEEVPTLSLDDALNTIITNYNTDKVKTSFKGWNETLVMRFPDLGKSYMYIINGSEGLEFKEGDDPEAAVQVEMDSTLFQKLIAKQVNAIKAYSSGKMNVSGQMKNMLKLRKLMF
ncbi:MAG: hypothetical protein EU530_08345 [Promethearchaeota archaeon]|nr:MAG: hypothetical protein EU530_08345 [Candidatus Lokiarchaeota archaeon]